MSRSPTFRKWLRKKSCCRSFPYGMNCPGQHRDVLRLMKIPTRKTPRISNRSICPMSRSASSCVSFSTAAPSFSVSMKKRRTVSETSAKKMKSSSMKPTAPKILWKEVSTSFPFRWRKAFMIRFMTLRSSRVRSCLRSIITRDAMSASSAAPKSFTVLKTSNPVIMSSIPSTASASIWELLPGKYRVPSATSFISSTAATGSCMFRWNSSASSVNSYPAPASFRVSTNSVPTSGKRRRSASKKMSTRSRTVSSIFTPFVRNISVTRSRRIRRSRNSLKTTLNMN